jgi:hypothetical protein
VKNTSAWQHAAIVILILGCTGPESAAPRSHAAAAASRGATSSEAERAPEGADDDPSGSTTPTVPAEPADAGPLADAAARACLHGDGRYCGGNGVDGDPGTLYVCAGGNATVLEACAAGCAAQPAGTNDFCNVKAGAPRPIPDPRNILAAWKPHVRRAAEQMYGAFPGILSFFTYPNHGVTEDGRDGEPYGIDAQVAPWGQRANAAQKALGDQLQKYLEDNWKALGVYYVIWWNRIAFAPGAWKPYDYRLYTQATTADVDSLQHLDHVHVQMRISPP